MVGGVGGVASGTGAPRFSAQQTGGGYELPKRTYKSTTTSSTTVRKVQKIPATGVASSTTGTRGAWGTSASSKPSAPATNTLITTSSWRAGKELADKILKDGNERGRGLAHDRQSTRREKSPEYSDASSSLSHLGSSQDNISSMSSSLNVRVRPVTERGRLGEGGVRLDEARDRYSSGGACGVKAGEGGGRSQHGVSMDMAGILEDLESTESPLSVGGGGGVTGTTGSEARLGRTRSSSGGPAAKKPRCNVAGE